ncbi:MAG: nitrate reductase molybdenum cofactor assembly chaperone, partial [Bauldia sp.]
MADTFKVLSALLDYPAEALRQAVPELRAAIAD